MLGELVALKRAEQSGDDLAATPIAARGTAVMLSPMRNCWARST